MGTMVAIFILYNSPNSLAEIAGHPCDSGKAVVTGRGGISLPKSHCSIKVYTIE